MKRLVWIVVGAAVVAVGIVAIVSFSSRQTDEQVRVKAAGMAKSLGIPAAVVEEIPEKAEERELEMLQSGEAAKSVDLELEKAESLLKKQEPGSDQHRMLVRRVAMLKKLKDRMGRPR